MDQFLKEKPPGKVNKTALFVGAVVGIALIGAIAVGVSFLPTAEEKKEDLLAGAMLPGSKGFEAYTRDIIITTDTNRLQESRTGLGDVVMRIGSRIRNKGDRTITGLEISVGMVDSKNQIIREKKYLIIPNKYKELGPDETIDVDANVGGFKEGDDRANAFWRVTAIKLKD
ncbi:MAG: hypothetical protein OEM82_15165 [Acidobacteriota bacterium]|nr:hypothetical protein [Acidobacteriota bacterium]